MGKSSQVTKIFKDGNLPGLDAEKFPLAIIII